MLCCKLDVLSACCGGFDLLNIEKGRDRNDDFYSVFSDACAFDYDWHGVFYYETGDV